LYESDLSELLDKNYPFFIRGIAIRAISGCIGVWIIVCVRPVRTVRQREALFLRGIGHAGGVLKKKNARLAKAFYPFFSRAMR